jgi:hypothetical protein
MAIENIRSDSPFKDPLRMGGVSNEPDEPSTDEKEEMRRQALHGRLMDWLQQERDKQSINRYQMAIDEDFYDGLQYSDDDAQTLIGRGQAPLVYNLIKPTINWLLGTERRTRLDGKVLPRSEDDEQNAEVKNKMMKYFSDVNKTPFARSLAWASCVTAGLGWLEDGVSTNPEEEILYSRYENWRYVYHDSTATELDLQDARYLFRFKWLDLDVAIALLPMCEADLRSAAIDSDALQIDEDDTYYIGTRVNGSEAISSLPQRRSFVTESGTVVNRRQRVKVYEGWFREPKRVQMLRGGKHHGEIYDPNNPDHVSACNAEFSSIVSHVRMQMRCALFTESKLLYDCDSPYKHNRFPLTPMWCYRRKRDGMPYGVIRDIRDPQEDYNKRASKALYILSTNRVVMDDGAVDDIDTLRAEVSRPDSIISKKKGYELRIENDKVLATEHLQLADRDAKIIFDTGGVTQQNLGQDDKGLSGQAIGKLQDQGSVVTAPLFDNMRYAVQVQSSIQLSLMEQYCSETKVYRIVGEKKPIEWLMINQRDPDTGEYLNDITANAADYVISEQDFRASMRQAMFETMMELIGKLDPQIGLALLDMVIDFADVPNKDELVARIRKINGQRDPSLKPTPQEIQAQKQADDEAQAAKALAQQTQQAALDKILAEVEGIKAATQKSTASAIKEAVTAAYEALQGAQIVSTIPNVTPVADAILAGAGYKDQGGENPNIPEPSGTIPQLSPQDAHGDFVGGPAQGAPTPPNPNVPDPAQAAGAQAGIETPTNDGVQQ